MPSMKDLIQLSRHDDHDNPFLQKQATPGPSRQRPQQQTHQQRQYTQQTFGHDTSHGNDRNRMNMMNNNNEADISFPMPSPIPASKYAEQRRQVESDLDRDLGLGGLTDDDEFDSNHTFSRLGGFGKDTVANTRSLIQSRSMLDRQMGFDTDSEGDDGMNISRGTEQSSFDAHARRSGLKLQQPHHNLDLERRDQLPTSATESSSSLSTASIEFARTAPAQQHQNHGFSHNMDLNDFEKSLFVGGSPVSTLGHHASAVTFGAGIFANNNNKGGYAGYDDAEGEGAGEYDPERGIEGLIAAAKIVPPSDKGEKNVFQHDSYQNPPTQRSIFGPTIPNPSQRHLHRPVQPSPLRVQANSPLNTLSTTTFGSRSGSGSQKQQDVRRASSGGALPEQAEAKKNNNQSQGGRRISEGRKVMSPIDGFDNARPASSQRRVSDKKGESNTPTASATTSRKTHHLDLMEGANPKVRIVSASSTQLDHRQRPERSLSASNSRSFVGNGTGMGDLTGLTGMLATPAKGLLHRRVGDDGERRQSGANIDGALRKMESDMQVMRKETEQSRLRIRDLELELEQARIAASRAEREAERYKGEKVELQDAVDRLKDEKTALESLVEALKDDVFRLEANLDKEMGRVHMIQQEVQKRTPARPLRNKANEVPSQAIELGDLLPLVNHLTRKVDGLETEVARLKDVVEGAYERTVGEINLPLKTKQSIGQEDQRPPSRAHTDPGRKSQYAEGVQTAAYYDIRSDISDAPQTAPIRSKDEAKSRKTMMMTEAAQDDGDSSPTPRSRVYSDSRSLSAQRNRDGEDEDAEGHRPGRKSVHDSRSDEPQEDPASSPFPAIRGNKLEREFFSPAPKAARDQTKPRQTKDLAARVEDAEDVDEGYGGEEIIHTAVISKTAVRPNKDSAKRVAQEIEHELDGGKVPPQTNVMKVLRELEDDYKHYLSIYTDLAEQYRRMSPLSTKRNVLAEHLKEVIDTMEQKANQVACLTEVLEVRDKPYMAPVIKAARASKARMSVPETVRAIRKDLGPGAIATPQLKITPRRRSGRHVAM